MNSLRVFNRQVGIFAVAGALLLAVIVPAIVSAAQLSARSIALSSSSAGAEDVSYTINFTSADPAGAFVVDFCENSPLIGEACDTPAGFTVAAVSSATTDFTDVASLDANTVRVTAGGAGIGSSDEVSVVLDNIDNPTDPGTIYARIVTYDTATNANGYVSTETSVDDTDRVDEGGAAISINNTIGVSGAVLESMTFCVSGANDIGEGCAPTDAALDAPTLKLGEDVGDTVALVPGTVSTGSLWTQLSTNAASGAVVSLKSSTEGCGGLLRFGADPEDDCDIQPALSGNVTTSAARFGVRTNAAVNVGSNANGTLQPVPLSNYNDTTYALNWVIGDATGVTSTFGDPFLNTNGAPANNKNMEITFGASVTNDTPAGLYSADLSLIATGKF